ncbi:MAG: hypothetical protein HOU81_00535 [Hamadaea sp.]|uniref:hypothetical protein n=1 Tax=Hamadaea sp. TaxID=2024425 RepID=UPI0018165C46|nr:hypothetical protein [Hamadaea sp.]NUR69283.1 hypothetical protein [Hamadaea sp.]NUT22013.1 hypothetical protein [Hamadaea sp.]
MAKGQFRFAVPPPEPPYIAATMIVFAIINSPGTVLERAVLIVAATPVMAIMIRESR